jgi:hypothetical protein
MLLPYLEGIIERKYIMIAIRPCEINNYTKVELVSIIEEMIRNVKRYEIKNLQVTNSDHVFPAHFKVTSMSEDIDIILGSTWIETLGIFTLNLKKKNLIFFF